MPTRRALLVAKRQEAGTTKAIQELAGHVSLTTTQRYMHLSPAAKESAIRLLEFDVRGEKKREIGESSAAKEEKGR